MTKADIRQAILDEALSWMGTPYHHQADVKGEGVDCLMLLVRVFVSCGLVPPIDPRPYSTQWHFHRSEEIYLGGLERYARRLDVAEVPLPGDIAMWQFGYTFSHGGIVLNDREVIHAHAKCREVTIADRWGDAFVGRPVLHYRVFGVDE